MQIKLDISHRFEGLGEIGAQVVERTLDLTSSELWGQVRREAPVDHGRLAGSFLLESRGRLEHAVYTMVEYAMAVHEGTKPHAILPKFAKALFWPGARHPVARVNHPGTAANKYADRAIDATERRVDEFAQTAVDEILEGGVV